MVRKSYISFSQVFPITFILSSASMRIGALLCIINHGSVWIAMHQVWQDALSIWLHLLSEFSSKWLSVAIPGPRCLSVSLPCLPRWAYPLYSYAPCDSQSELWTALHEQPLQSSEDGASCDEFHTPPTGSESDEHLAGGASAEQSTEDLVGGLVDYMGTLVPGMEAPSTDAKEGEEEEEDDEEEEDEASEGTSDAPPALPPKVRRGDGVATVNGTATDTASGDHRPPPPVVPPRRREKKNMPPVSISWLQVHFHILSIISWACCLNFSDPWAMAYLPLLKFTWVSALNT